MLVPQRSDDPVYHFKWKVIEIISLCGIISVPLRPHWFLPQSFTFLYAEIDSLLENIDSV